MKKFTFPFFSFLVFALGLLSTAHCTNWLVGPSKTYTKPSQVSGLVQNGDTVSIDAGTYASDVAHWTASNLLLRGIGGLAHLESNGLSWGDKAIWVIGGDNTTVEYIEFSECTSTSLNGAGIRQEAKNLTVRHCYFHDNENGILAGTINPSTILIEFTEFGYNGAGDGYSHNLYINHVDSLIFRYNYSHHCNVGHEIKSRAHVNLILYNRFSNEGTGNASREIDLPDGGTAIVIGNVIEQGPNSTNSGIIGYGMESLTNNAPHEFYFINNTVVNNKSNGTFVSIPAGTALYKSYNNIFAGAGTLLNGSATLVDTSNNWRATAISSVGFVNASGYDYHLTSSSQAIDGGTSPGTTNVWYPLTPVMEYKHSADSISRIPSGVGGQLDIGAFEFPFTVGVVETQGNFDFSFSVTNNILNILYDSDKNAIVKIIDLNGRNLKHENISKGKTELDISKFETGIYILEIISEGQRKSGIFYLQ